MFPGRGLAGVAPATCHIVLARLPWWGECRWLARWPDEGHISVFCMTGHVRPASPQSAPAIGDRTCHHSRGRAWLDLAMFPGFAQPCSVSVGPHATHPRLLRHYLCTAPSYPYRHPCAVLQCFQTKFRFYTPPDTHQTMCRCEGGCVCRRSEVKVEAGRL